MYMLLMSGIYWRGVSFRLRIIMMDILSWKRSGYAPVTGEEIKAGLKERRGDSREVHASIATGLLAEPFIREYVKLVQEKYPQVEVTVFGLRNDFFGEKITVLDFDGTGLMQAADTKRFR